jgi:hypothetical protein
MNVMGLFKSPMVLMMLFSGVMMYAMPKLQVRPLCSHFRRDTDFVGIASRYGPRVRTGYGRG